MKFNLSFEKEHAVSFLTAQTVDSVIDMVSSDSLTGNSPYTYQRYISRAKFPLQYPIMYD